MKYAVIETGGKQYLVSPGQTLKIEKISGLPASEVGASDSLVFDRVLMVADGDTVTLGNPIVAGVTVPATIKSEGRARKVIVIHFKPKTRERKKAGHRQPYLEVTIGDW